MCVVPPGAGSSCESCSSDVSLLARGQDRGLATRANRVGVAEPTVVVLCCVGPSSLCCVGPSSLRPAALPGIVVVPDETSAINLHALITGPEGTPYAHGFFYFLIGIPLDYPSSPPKVKLMTTGGGKASGTRQQRGAHVSGSPVPCIAGPKTSQHPPGARRAGTLRP
jgi:hypothetical protein